MERLNDVLGYENLKIYQDDEFFTFSLDSIILANYCNIRLRDKKVADFCSGNGIVSLILTKRTLATIDGIEIQKKLYDLALKSIKYNNLEERIKFFNEDIKVFSKNHLNYYDAVVCNPPYFKMDSNNKKNECFEKMVARHEIKINLAEVCLSAKKVLKDNGSLTIVHRSDRLMDILTEFRKNNIEPKRIKFIYESINKNSTLIVIEGQKNGKAGLIIEKPLIMFNEDGTYTMEYGLLQREVRK